MSGHQEGGECLDKGVRRQERGFLVPLAYGSVLAWYRLKSKLSAPPEDEEKEDDIRKGGGGRGGGMT